MLPRMGLIVTTLETDSRAVMRFYNKRGTAEQWIREGKQSGEDYAAELSPVPGERGAAVAERHCLQREPLAAARAAEAWM